MPWKAVPDGDPFRDPDPDGSWPPGAMVGIAAVFIAAMVFVAGLVALALALA
jgi:hypothetical protein